MDLCDEGNNLRFALRIMKNSHVTSNVRVRAVVRVQHANYNSQLSGLLMSCVA